MWTVTRDLTHRGHNANPAATGYDHPGKSSGCCRFYSSTADDGTTSFRSILSYARNPGIGSVVSIVSAVIVHSLPCLIADRRTRTDSAEKPRHGCELSDVPAAFKRLAFGDGVFHWSFMASFRVQKYLSTHKKSCARLRTGCTSTQAIGSDDLRF